MSYKQGTLLVTFICAIVLLFFLWESKLDVRDMHYYIYKDRTKQCAVPIFKSHDLFEGNSYNPNDLTVELAASRLALHWTNGDVFNNCTKSKRIYYAKSPKTGSTSLRWVLYSFALRNKLQICTDAVY